MRVKFITNRLCTLSLSHVLQKLYIKLHVYLTSVLADERICFTALYKHGTMLVDIQDILSIIQWSPAVVV